MWRIFGLGVAALLIVVVGFNLVDIGAGESVEANAVLGTTNIDMDGFTRATRTDYDWQFPQDHGPHRDFLTEWWYYTGNLATDDGRRFGYQFTVFRRAILPTPPIPGDASEWRTNQVYLAHFTVSDIADNAFYHDERLSRGAAGLAGATTDPVYRVWLEDWEVRAINPQATQLRMTAATEGAAIDLTLEQAKPPVLQGTNGLSPKSDDPGNASYYYSIPRLLTEGTITIGGQTYTVSGNTWMDQEFSTSALGGSAQGWDWFGLIFDDGTEMMIGQIRLTDSGRETAFGGLYIREDASTVYLPSASLTITPTATYRSSYTNTEYPVAWELTVDADTLGRDTPLTITATALMQDQELQTNPTYWEGAVEIGGDKTGYGYAELTGYAGAMRGFF